MSLHGGAGEGVHHALGQRAGGRCFGHHLVLWSGHWSQYAHYKSIKDQYSLSLTQLILLFVKQRCRVLQHKNVKVGFNLLSVISSVLFTNSSLK